MSRITVAADLKLMLSPIQMARGRTSDRNIVTAELTGSKHMLNITVSKDGGMMREGIKTCGISGADTTQHFEFLITLNMESENPIPPRHLTAEEIVKLAREGMSNVNKEVPEDTYNAYFVTPNSADCKSVRSKNPKYRAEIVGIADHPDFCPGVIDEEFPNLRMPHVVFIKPRELLADNANKSGSAIVVSRSTIMESAKVLKRMMHMAMDSGKSVPVNLELFSFSSVETMGTFIDHVAKIATDRQESTDFNNGNFLYEMLNYCYFIIINTLSLHSYTVPYFK